MYTYNVNVYIKNISKILITIITEQNSSRLTYENKLANI